MHCKLAPSAARHACTWLHSVAIWSATMLRRHGICCRRSSRTARRTGWQWMRICAPRTPCPCSSTGTHVQVVTVVHPSVPQPHMPVHAPCLWKQPVAVSKATAAGYTPVTGGGCNHLPPIHLPACGNQPSWWEQQRAKHTLSTHPPPHPAAMHNSPGGQVLFIVSATLSQYG